jgi:3-hydroxypropionyl-CoA synthetase (ADP-forming)
MMDPVFGPAVMVGAGGIFTELFKDVTFRLAPCPQEEALRMLKELTVYPLIEGYRGSTIDPNKFARIISIVGNMIVDLGNVFSQLDINPIVYSEGRWAALDAMIVLRE